MPLPRRYEEEPEGREITPEEKAELFKHAEEPLFKTVVDRAARSHFQMLFLVAATLGLLVVIGSGLSASHGYALVETQQKAEQLEQENERLRIENARLRSPQRIKELAEKELGMEMPKVVYYAHEN